MSTKSFAPYALAFSFLVILGACQHQASRQRSATDHPRPEVMYHIFERSFYDSNGDGIGDFKGLTQKLGYLKELGVNAILLTPICQSVFYHNYFADDFEQIDSTYGSLQDWMTLVKTIHQDSMKVYLDMEMQYVTDHQKWYRDSYKNPASPYSDYLIYHGPGNTRPEPIIYNISHLVGYNDSARNVATVNLYNPGVQAYFYKLFTHWMDPDGDGNFQDGVDGFRIDHMMDNLDNKGVLTGLFGKFWSPLITRLKKENPRLMIVAEQANWADFGTAYFDSASVDRVFAFNLRNAIVSMNKQQISAMADSTFRRTPAGKQQVVFISNHDMERFSSAVGADPGKLRVGAAFNLLIGGIPSVYYGQELGMFGKGGFGRFGNTDGNDIPQREAFEWLKADSGRGMAIWYKHTGPWWDSTNLIPDDGISLEEEKNDPHSLWNFYRTLIHLHTSHAAFSGQYGEVSNDNNQVFSFIRYQGDDCALVAINLSPVEQLVSLDLNSAPVKWQGGEKLLNLLDGAAPVIRSGKAVLKLPAYGVGVWQMR